MSAFGGTVLSHVEGVRIIAGNGSIRGRNAFYFFNARNRRLKNYDEEYSTQKVLVIN